MLNFIKKQNIASYLTAVAFILTIVGVILVGVSSAVQGYTIVSLGAIIACSIIAALLMVAGIVLVSFFGSQNIFTTIANIAAMVLVMVAFCMLISERAVLASAQFSYDSVNQVGWSVLYKSIAGLILYFISAILLTAGAFFGEKKQAAAA